MREVGTCFGVVQKRDCIADKFLTVRGSHADISGERERERGKRETLTRQTRGRVRPEFAEASAGLKGIFRGSASIHHSRRCRKHVARHAAARFLQGCLSRICPRKLYVHVVPSIAAYPHRCFSFPAKRVPTQPRSGQQLCDQPVYVDALLLFEPL